MSMGTLEKPRPILRRKGSHEASLQNPERMSYDLLASEGTALVLVGL
jgi:hypothetical protein